jgi:hypothetical protein
MSDATESAVDRLAAVNSAETQWRVVWFPYDKPVATKTARNLTHAREIAAQHADHAPIVESRTVTCTPWDAVENWAGRTLVEQERS